MKYILLPLTVLYYILSKLKTLFLEEKDLGVPVVSIGNITWGGSGKTPLVVELAWHFSQNGKKACVLSRGYKRAMGKGDALLVSDGNKILERPDFSGDEPYMIAKEVPGTIVAVSNDRYQAFVKARERSKIDIVILDDGFQRRNIKRDLDIVCINSLNPFGNGWLIPSGILRETLSSLKRAGIVIITNTNFTPSDVVDSIKERVAKYSKAAIYSAVRSVSGIFRYIDEQKADKSDLKDKGAILFSGIADNKSFKNTAVSIGLNVSKHYEYPDHYSYKARDIKKIMPEYDENKNVFITTLKDSARIDGIKESLPDKFLHNLYILKTEINVIDGGDNWLGKVKEILRFS